MGNAVKTLKPPHPRLALGAERQRGDRPDQCVEAIGRALDQFVKFFLGEANLC
jgi:hypothetical protein